MTCVKIKIACGQKQITKAGRLGYDDVAGRYAERGQLISNGKKTPIYFHFYKENEQWKIDLTSLFPMTGVGFKKLVEESGQSENEFIFKLIELSIGKKPGPEVWQKIK